MKRVFEAFAFGLMLSAAAGAPREALATNGPLGYVPVGIAVAPADPQQGADYVFVVWSNTAGSYQVDEYEFTDATQEPLEPVSVFVQAESPIFTMAPGYTFAGITSGYNIQGGFFDPTTYLTFQKQGLLYVDTFNFAPLSGKTSASGLPLYGINPTVSMVDNSVFYVPGGAPVNVTGVSEDENGNLTFMSQFGSNAGFETWNPKGYEISANSVNIGTSQAGGLTASGTGYAIGPLGGYGRVLFYNPPSGTTILDEFSPSIGFPGIWTQPAFQTQMGSNYVPVSVSVTRSLSQSGGAATQLLWDGVTSPGINSAMVWNFDSTSSTYTSTPTWALPSNSATVGMASCNEGGVLPFLAGNYMGIQGSAPGCDYNTYVLAQDGVNSAMLYQVPIDQPGASIIGLAVAPPAVAPPAPPSN